MDTNTSLSGGSSAGLTGKDILETPYQDNKTSDQLQSLSSDALKREEALKAACCFRLCTRYKLCGITCGRFNDRKHAVFCTFFTVMIISLLVAIIVPLVS